MCRYLFDDYDYFRNYEYECRCRKLLNELNEKLERLAELNALLNMDEKGTEECLDEPGDEENLPEENRHDADGV